MLRYERTLPLQFLERAASLKRIQWHFGHNFENWISYILLQRFFVPSFFHFLLLVFTVVPLCHEKEKGTKLMLIHLFVAKVKLIVSFEQLFHAQGLVMQHEDSSLRSVSLNCEPIFACRVYLLLLDVMSCRQILMNSLPKDLLRLHPAISKD